MLPVMPPLLLCTAAWPLHSCRPEHRVVIVEGNYLLLKGVPVWNSICTLFDETWFLQCTLQQCADRVVARHIQTGLTHEVQEYYLYIIAVILARAVCHCEHA
jgi:hypothetical protein